MMCAKGGLAVAFALLAFAGVRAQDISLDDDSGGISLEEGGEPKPDPAEIAKKEKTDKEGRIIARLRKAIATASNRQQREEAQLRLLKMLKGDEFLDLAVELRDREDASKRMKTEVCELLCDSMRVSFGIWGTEWYSRYCENMSEERLARREREYFKSLSVLDGLAPKDAGRVGRYAESMLFRYTEGGDKADLAKARELFRREIELCAGQAKGKDAYGLCGAHWGELNCIFATGDTNATCRAIRDFLDRKLPESWGRGRRGYTGLAGAALKYLQQDPLDILKLPFFTDSKAFPEPQQCEYTENFAAAPAVRLETKGIARDDPRLHLLEVKYARYGIALDDKAPFTVRVEVDGATKMFDDLRDPAIFAKVREAKRFNPKREDGKVREDKSPDEFRDYMAAEGYALEVTEKGATIRAKTRQGALWGIVSLIQMTDRNRKAVRIAKMRDWPDVEKRGFLGSWWGPTLEFALFQKMNTVDHQRHPCFENRFEPLAWYLEEEMGRQFHAFGLELFYGMCWMTHAPQIPICFPRTLPYRVKVFKRYARAHIGIYYPLDDIRFPVCDEDLKAFGSAAAIDGKHQSAIYREVIKEFPDWRFLVCAPFYWGPTGRCGMYPEQRDPYLAQWRKDLDPGIEVYWTGPRVKSYSYEPWHNNWALEAYGRRPYMFQNGMGWHNLLGYTIDEMDWPSTYCKGTLDKTLKAYHLNAHTPVDCAKITTLGDALWNIGGYDAARAVRRGVAQLMGERMFDILQEGYEDLCYFDKYRYGDAGDNVVEEDLADLEKRVANASSAWKRATEYAKSIGSQMYGHYGQGVGYAHKVLAARRRPSNIAEKYKGLLDETASVAKNETHFDARGCGDRYLSPSDLSGGRVDLLFRTPPDSEERAKDHPRLTTALCGKDAKPVAKTTGGTFECETFPPGGDYLLCVSALDKGKSKVRIKVNDTVIFEGAREFGRHPNFKLATFKIPAMAMKRNNTFSIENLGPGVDGWQMTGTEMFYGRVLRIGYVVVLTTDKLRAGTPTAEESLIELDE